MVLMAVVIAIAMKVVGVLLITSLLIIPSAATRRFCRTPEQMAALAAILGCAAVAIGNLALLPLRHAGGAEHRGGGDDYLFGDDGVAGASFRPLTGAAVVIASDRRKRGNPDCLDRHGALRLAMTVITNLRSSRACRRTN